MIEAALLALINPDNEIFMCLRRKDADTYPDMWEFPAGCVDAGETPMQAALRECREEIAVIIAETDCHFLASYPGGEPDKPFTAHVFYAHHPKEIHPVFGEGQQAWRWMTADDIWEYNHIPSNKIILSDLFLKIKINENKSESLY